MPLREYRIRARKAEEQKERRLTQLLRLCDASHQSHGPGTLPDIVSLEKFVAYNYPRLAEQTVRDYARGLYSRLKRGP